MPTKVLMCILTVAALAIPVTQTVQKERSYYKEFHPKRKEGALSVLTRMDLGRNYKNGDPYKLVLSLKLWEPTVVSAYGKSHTIYELDRFVIDRTDTGDYLLVVRSNMPITPRIKMIPSVAKYQPSREMKPIVVSEEQRPVFNLTFHPADFPKTMRRGKNDREVEGWYVITLQEALQKNGFTAVVVTSYFDSQTDNALREFQRKHKLVVDGIVGDETMRLLRIGKYTDPENFKGTEYDQIRDEVIAGLGQNIDMN